VIAESRPDVVALQELDVGRARTQGIDQAHAIAEMLGMAFHFNAALQVEEELYGDAVLTSTRSGW
jgi:endonuclease/exonuclease/phosphatase family metal-dependent hydrolase